MLFCETPIRKFWTNTEVSQSLTTEPEPTREVKPTSEREGHPEPPQERPSEADPESVTQQEPVAVMEPEPEPEPVVEMEREPEPETQPEPVVVTEPEPEPEPVAKTEPEPELAPEHQPRATIVSLPPPLESKVLLLFQKEGSIVAGQAFAELACHSIKRT